MQERSRLTRHRRAVLEVIRRSDNHPTAAQIFSRVQKKQPRVAYATIYNALAWLSRHGAIGEIKFGDDAVRYDWRTGRHDHLVCSRCQRLTDVEISLNPRVLRHIAKQKRFVVERYHIQVQGLCIRCQKQAQSGQSKSPRRRARSLRQWG